MHTVTTMDRGISYAESCFETFRIIHGHVFAWNEHWQRLQTGLQAFGITLVDNDVQLLETQCLHAAAACADDCIVRVTVTGGIAARSFLRSSDMRPEVYIQATPFAQPAPAHMALLDYPFPLKSKLAKFSSDYAESLRAIHAWQASLTHGQTSLEPLLHQHQHLLSGAMANILLYIGQTWITPTCSNGILNGIIRDHLCAQRIVHERACSLADLEQAEAAALCNSGALIRPIASVNAHDFDVAHTALQQLWHGLAGHEGIPTC